MVGAADPTLPTMVVHRPEAMVRRVGRYGLIGFGESYMAGDWSSSDLAGVLTEFTSIMGLSSPASGLSQAEPAMAFCLLRGNLKAG